MSGSKSVTYLKKKHPNLIDVSRFGVEIGKNTCSKKLDYMLKNC